MGMGIRDRLCSVLAIGICLTAFPVQATEALDSVPVEYELEAIVDRGQWWLGAWGNRGQSHWDGRAVTLDFTQGASAVSLHFADRSLPGAVTRVIVTVRGQASGQEVSLHLRTHFMTFSKSLGLLDGAGEHVLETDGPPGPGWTWGGGENDGKIHGPMRLGELRFKGNGKQDSVRLELVSIRIEARAPIQKRVLLHARADLEGKGPGFVAHGRAFSEQPLDGSLVWTLRRWDGQTLSQGSRSISLPGGLKEVAAAIPVPSLPEGCRFVEAEVGLEIPGQDVTPVTAYWLADPPPNRDLSRQPESPFGMGVYLGRFNLDEMKRVAELAGRAGVKWSREDFSWSRIEPRQGEFQWDYYDKLIETAHDNGITVYAIICYWTPWTQPYTQQGIDDYVRYARALVRRYKDRIKQWEIWNEPNIFFWQGPREMYADLLIKAYQAIKEEDPEAEVLGLSTAGIDYAFIDQMLERNTPFDILTIHPYRRHLDDTGFINELKKASDQVLRADGRRRPVWITEMGWATHVEHHVLKQDFAPNSQRAQAELLTRTYLCTIASGVEPRTFWYNFRNDGEDPFYFEHNMGILHRDGRPKPAYVAYATMTRVLRGQRFAGTRSDLGDVFSAQFEARDGSSRRVLALWSATRDQSVTVPMEAEKVALVNTIGEERRLRPEQGGVKVALRAGSPVYIVTEADR